MTTELERLAEREPVRVQLSRRKGWKMPPNTVKVSRPGYWGNPFVVTEKVKPGVAFSGAAWGCVSVPTASDAVACYREMFSLRGDEAVEEMIARLPELRGKNLACWCPLTDKDGNPVPCHADVLLELANSD